jgi:DNA polymerase
MSTLFLDLETYCETPINVGTHRYAEGAEIMVAARAIDAGPVDVLDFTAGDAEIRMDILRKEIDAADIVVIHNSAFDRTVLRHRGIHLPTEKVVDTMVLAMMHSLPGGLGKLCDILGVPLDQAKDQEGKKLIKLFCMPRPKNMKLRRATRETHPTEWAAFLEYARLDIEAMRAIYKKLPKWNATDTERQVWLLDQVINDRGFQTDTDLVSGAIRAIDREQLELRERAWDLTEGAVSAATQRDAMLDHVLAQYDIRLEDMKASTIERMLEDDNYPLELLELLRVRLQATTSSTAKYKKLAAAVSSDGRLRGTLQYAGALRTMRWSGRVFQPQNLVRPNLDQGAIDAGIEALKADCVDLVVDNVMELCSNALRGVIVAPAGKKLVVADLSNIEGRVLAWLAGETWKLEAFAAYDRGEGPDLYKVTAGRILGKKPDEVTKKERQEVGKVAELALGYEGGVGAFLTFATAYGIDLDDLAAIATENLPATVVEDSRGLYEWFQGQKKSTLGLERATWVGIDAIKRAWRQAHPATTQLWRDLAQDAEEAFMEPGEVVGTGKLAWARQGAWLRMRLPSGRSLCYPGASYDTGKLSYMGVNQYSRQWDRLGSYGGKLAENATQAVARDVLAEGMLRVEKAGFDIVLSVHDELITETPDSDVFDAEMLSGLMSIRQGWANGLPLAAAGFETHRYRKD